MLCFLISPKNADDFPVFLQVGHIITWIPSDVYTGKKNRLYLCITYSFLMMNDIVVFDITTEYNA